jgi:peptidyl-prolyl cis-trans isomerase D
MIRFLQSGNKAAKYLLSAFLLIICVGMVVYLIPGFMSDAGATQSGVVATVGDQKIHTEEVNQLVQAQMRGQNLPPGLAGFFAQRAVQSLIQRAEVQYEAKRMGLSVSDEEVRSELRNGQYKDIFFPGGQWIGQKQYEDLMRSNNYTVERFERGLRDDLLQRKLFNAITASVDVSPGEVEQAYKDQNTQVKFQYAFLDMATVAKEIKPSDAELKAYFDANKARYQNAIPERREVRYFILNDREAENKVTVSDAEVQNYYNGHREQYRMPDRAKLKRILINFKAPGAEGKADQKAIDAARTKAQDIVKQIKAGGNFAELAKKYSQDQASASSGGELGWIVKGQFPSQDVENVAFNQGIGQTSDPMETTSGFEILQTEEKEQARLKPVSEVKPGIEKLVKAQKAGTLLAQESSQAEELAKKEGLDKAAAKFGVQVVPSGEINRGSLLPGIGAAPELMGQIFTSTEKSGPQLTHASQGYVVFEVTKITPGRTPSFDEIKDRVATEFKNERSTDLMRKKTQEMADRAHATHDLAKAAKEQGATLKTSNLVGRNDRVDDIGAMAGPASVALTMKPGEISGPLNTGQRGLVLAVVEKKEPSTADEQFAKQKDHLFDQLADQKRQQVIELFMANLNKRMEDQKKIEINKTEMNNLTKARS